METVTVLRDNLIGDRFDGGCRIGSHGTGGYRYIIESFGGIGGGKRWRWLKNYKGDGDGSSGCGTDDGYLW